MYIVFTILVHIGIYDFDRKNVPASGDSVIITFGLKCS